ncbi:MAG: hypothetical protein ACREFY_13685 [Acetobacteraceae bacterium]
MNSPSNLPNGRVLLQGMMLSRERLQDGSRAAVSIPLLKAILTIASSKLPFDMEFYLSTYPDIRDAYNAGLVADVKAHFAEEGYFEGRLGAMPEIDEKFYRETYPDVADAIASGQVASAADH